MARLAALLLFAAPAALAISPAAQGGMPAELRIALRNLADYEGPSDMPTNMPATVTEADSITMPAMPTMPPGEMPPAGEYEHLGCFVDSKADRVLGHTLKSPNITAAMCLDHCNKRGAAYMATQYGHECWCSRQQDLDYQRHGVGTCEMFCLGDETETCGGRDAFDLYKLEWPGISTDPEYIECFADAKHDRVMSHMISTDDMTPAKCRAHCDLKGALYYGTQFGRECWCGTSDDIESYQRHDLGTCHMPCSGDHTIACGGRDAFSLYELQDGSSMIPTTSSAHPCPSSASTSSTHTHSMGSTTADAMAVQSVSDDPGMYADLLDKHNQVRCMHGAPPLTWSAEVARHATTYAGQLVSTKCGQLVHSSGSGYGENLYMCWNNESCYSAKGAMNGWYDKEVTEDVGTYGAQAIEVLWASSTQLGCAVDSCDIDGTTYDVLVCNYSPPGGFKKEISENVMSLSSSAETCDYD